MRKLLLVLVAPALLALPGAPVAAAPPKPPKPASLVARTVAATAKVKSFHFVLDVAHPPANPLGLSISHAEGDVRVPDALAARFTGTLSGIVLKSSLVFVGTRYFLQDPFSGKWRPLSANTNPVKFFNPARGVLAIVRGARGLAVVGSDRVAGVDCWRLVGKVPTAALTYVLGAVASPRLVPLTLWVGKADAVLREARLAGRVNAGDPARVSRSLVVSRLDERVTIKAPKVTG